MFTALESLSLPIAAGFCTLAFCVGTAYVLRWLDKATTTHINHREITYSAIRDMRTQLDALDTLLITTRTEATLLRNRVCELEDRERQWSLLLQRYGQMEAVYTFPPATPDPRPTLIDSHRSITLPRTS